MAPLDVVATTGVDVRLLVVHVCFHGLIAHCRAMAWGGFCAVRRNCVVLSLVFPCIQGYDSDACRPGKSSRSGIWSRTSDSKVLGVPTHCGATFGDRLGRRYLPRVESCEPYR